MENQTIITVRGLSKKFGNFTAVDNVSFDVQRAEIFGFLGPNGSGKTTSIRMMLGLLEPSAGEVDLLGVNVRTSAHEIRNRIGYMSQRFSLYNDLTVMQNLQFYSAAYSLRSSMLRTRIGEALEMSGLEGKEDVRTSELSGGWRQRLALSVAIIHRPQVIFLDEPTSGVDPVSRREFWDLLYQLVKEEVTIFVTTHYMDEAEHCHRLAFILDGRIIAYGSPDEIKNQTFRNNILELVPEDPKKIVSLLEEAKESGQLPLDSIELYGSMVHLYSENPNLQKLVKKFLNQNNAHVNQIFPIEPSLEDVFIESVRKNNQRINQPKSINSFQEDGNEG